VPQKDKRSLFLMSTNGSLTSIMINFNPEKEDAEGEKKGFGPLTARMYLVPSTDENRKKRDRCISEKRIHVE